MELRFNSADEFGWFVALEDGDDTLIHGKEAISSLQCRMVHERLQEPGLPRIKFVRERSTSKISGRPQHHFSCHFLTADEQVDFGWSGYYPTPEEVEARIARIKANTAPLTLLQPLPEPPKPMPAKKTAKKTPAKKTAARKTPAKKTSKAAGPAITRKHLIDTISDRTGIPPVDVGLVIDGVIKEAAEALRAGGQLTLRDLGTFIKGESGDVVFRPSTTFLGKLD